MSIEGAARSGGIMRRKALVQRALWAVIGIWGVLAVTALLVMVGMRLAGVQFNVVQTASMTPALPIDSLTMTRPVEAATIAVDDVIMFANREGELVMHRVTEIIEHNGVRRFRTKGDANRTTDTQLVHENSVTGGLVGSVPNVGSFARSVQSPIGFVYLAVFLAPLLAWAWRGRLDSGSCDAIVEVPPAQRRPERAMVMSPSGGVLCPSWLTA